MTKLYVAVRQAYEYYTSYLDICGTDLEEVQKEAQIWEKEESYCGCDCHVEYKEVEVNFDILYLSNELRRHGVEIHFPFECSTKKVGNNSEYSYNEIIDIVQFKKTEDEHYARFIG